MSGEYIRASGYAVPRAKMSLYWLGFHCQTNILMAEAIMERDRRTCGLHYPEDFSTIDMAPIPHYINRATR